MAKLFYRLWQKFLRIDPLKVQVIFLTIAITFGVIVYYYRDVTTKNALASQLLHRQQVIARSGAISLTGFTNSIGRSLRVMAKTTDLTSGQKSRIDEQLAAFVNSWYDTPVRGISFTNKDGVVVSNKNRAGIEQVGQDVSDRQYFIWGREAPESDYFIGSPVVSRFGETKGNYVVPVATPIYGKDGEFAGVLTAVMDLRAMVTWYSEPLKISDKTNVYLINPKGEFVFSSVPKLQGTSVAGLFGDIDFPGKDKMVNYFLQKIKSTDPEGKADLVLPDMENGGTLTRYLASYSRVRLDSGEQWTLVVVTPASDAFLFIAPFHRNQTTAFVYMLAITLISTLIGITTCRVKHLR